MDSRIDISFNFTIDTKGYWDGFWEGNDGLGRGKYDPDSKSPTLQEYHRILWSKELPNGEKIELTKGNSRNYLTWKNFRFSSDSIIVTLRYKKYRQIITEFMNINPNYKEFYEDIIIKSYTIGGMIIFPKHRDSINQGKGTNTLISDRLDLTLECIRRYYNNEPSPLTRVLEKDKEFFDLFVNFEGYINYFFLQDCVTPDFKSVIIWDGQGDFSEKGLPKTLDNYLRLIDNEMEFLEKRNQRIKQYCEKNNI